MAVAGDDNSELLFFDTFSHDIHDELNLDLVQFPSPVYITELRIIPLGARVEADFPGGVRLGATNPSSFEIDFFVNDLTKPGASTFEKLGNFMYNQNDCINMVCEGSTTIPTDGLVLRGWYTTITLAVYGTLTKNIMEQIASPPAETNLQLNESDKMDVASIPVSVDDPKEVAEIEPSDEFPSKYIEETPPKDPRREFSATVDPGDWPEEQPPQQRSERIREVDWDKSNIRPRRSPGRRKSETRRSFSRSTSRDGSGFVSANRDWSRSPVDYQNSRRTSRGSTAIDVRKRPRTPPMTESLSPSYNRRPRSPDHVIPLSDDDQRNIFPRSKDQLIDERAKSLQSPTSTPGTPLESPVGMDDDLQAVEQFELIESDEEIGDDMDQFDFELDEYEESLKMFNPLDLQKFNSELESEKIAKEFEVIGKVLNKFRGLRRKEFESLSRDERENWVHCVERVNNHLAQVYTYQRSFAEPHIAKLLAAGGDGGHRETIIQALEIGLDYNCAMSQVAVHYRHLKVGLKFAELIGCYEQVAREVLAEEKFDIFGSLFDLYNEPFMAMSLQMMILKTVASILDTKSAVGFFLKSSSKENGEQINYYQRILKMIESNPKIYLKFALKAIIKKLNTFETLDCVRETTQKWIATASSEGDRSGDYENILQGCLLELVDTYVFNDLSLSHSKHFVPVPQKIEIVHDEMTVRAVAHCLDSYFRSHVLLETLSLLIVQRHELSVTTNKLVMDLLQAITRNSYGFLYLCERFEATMVIVRSLLQNSISMEDWTADPQNEWWQLGVEIAYKLQTKYHLDAIRNLTDEFDIVDHLTAMYNLTTSNLGRNVPKREEDPKYFMSNWRSPKTSRGVEGWRCVCDVICMNDNLTVIRDLIEAEKEKVQAMESSTKYKSPTLSYSVDVLDCLVRHGTNMQMLQEHGKQLLNIAKCYDIFESNVSAMLQELLIYLKPLDQPQSVFSYDDASLLCDLIKKSFEFFTTFPGDLITCLRIARYMAIPGHFASHDEAPEVDEQTEGMGKKEYNELKHKLFLVQFYSSEGYSLLVTILEKIATHFQQPKMHSSNLVGNQGVLVLQVLLPTVQILRRVLMMVIEARNTDFRDVTAVVPLLNIYNLLHNIPATALAYQDAQRTQVEIVKTLLCYTQPSPPEGVDNESVKKSLWSLVVGEVIKFTLSTPSTFIPGLLVFSELLPLPLPILSADIPAQREIQRVLTERQLWSAYLHPQTNAIVELIQTLCPTSYPPLIMLLVRVCLQMADLGPNMSVVVARTILELFMSQSLTAGVANSHHLRLMNYLGNLVGHATIKSAVLSLLSPKLMEMWTSVLTTSSAESVHQQTQESILIMFQSLLDCENSFYSGMANGVDREIVLASVIPTVEVLQGIVNSCLDHVLGEEGTGGGGGSANVLPVLRNLMLFTEHDITIRILRSAVDKRRLRLLATFRRLVTGFVESSKADGATQAETETQRRPRNIVAALIEFLRLLITIDAPTTTSADEVPIPSRTVVLTGPQLGVLLSYWTKEAGGTFGTETMALKEEAAVPVSDDLVVSTATTTPAEVTTEVGGTSEAMTVDSAKTQSSEQVEGEKERNNSATDQVAPSQDEGDVVAATKHPILDLREFLEVNRTEENDAMLDKCNEIISYLEGSGAEGMEIDGLKEEQDSLMPPPEGIVAQYAVRQVYQLAKLGEPADERLKLNYWLNPPNYEEELGDMEQVPCDLTELIKTCLPADTNLVADCKRILNLSVSPQSNRERTVTAPCFRTRRIEMEPLGGRMEKKFLGKAPIRGRGFARTPPSRGDLFRSRPPNTSRPPSLHVDDFMALDGSHTQSTGPSGYNKSGIVGGMRGRGRGRGGFQGVDKGRVATSGLYRQSIPTWSQQGPAAAQTTGETPPGPTHFRTATQTPQYGNDAHHYHRDNHFVSNPRGRGFYRNRNYPR